jgi:hypothetical protein
MVFQLTDKVLQVADAYWTTRWRHFIIFILLLLGTMMVK